MDGSVDKCMDVHKYKVVPRRLVWLATGDKSGNDKIIPPYIYTVLVSCLPPTYLQLFVALDGRRPVRLSPPQNSPHKYQNRFLTWVARTMYSIKSIAISIDSCRQSCQTLCCWSPQPFMIRNWNNARQFRSSLQLRSHFCTPGVQVRTNPKR